MEKTRYEQLIEAKSILELPEKATWKEIKAKYRALLHQWHPDKSEEPVELCEEMVQQITDAYEVISIYCNEYSFSFSDEELKECRTDEEWWNSRFGKDPVWNG